MSDLKMKRALMLIGLEVERPGSKWDNDLTDWVAMTEDEMVEQLRYIRTLVVEGGAQDE